jgi:hypothetical protein
MRWTHVPIEQGVHGLEQQGDVDRLAQGPVRPDLPGDLQELHLVGGAAARHGDDLQAGVALAQLDDRLDPFLVGHQHVDDRRVGGQAVEDLYALHPVGRLEYGVAFRFQSVA